MQKVVLCTLTDAQIAHGLMHDQVQPNSVAWAEGEPALPTADHSGSHHSELQLEIVGTSKPQWSLVAGSLVASDRQLPAPNTDLNITHDGPLDFF